MKYFLGDNVWSHYNCKNFSNNETCNTEIIQVTCFPALLIKINRFTVKGN